MDDCWLKRLQFIVDAGTHAERNLILRSSGHIHGRDVCKSPCMFNGRIFDGRSKNVHRHILAFQIGYESVERQRNAIYDVVVRSSKKCDTLIAIDSYVWSWGQS